MAASSSSSAPESTSSATPTTTITPNEIPSLSSTSIYSTWTSFPDETQALIPTNQIPNGYNFTPSQQERFIKLSPNERLKFLILYELACHRQEQERFNDRFDAFFDRMEVRFDQLEKRMEECIDRMETRIAEIHMQVQEVDSQLETGVGRLLNSISNVSDQQSKLKGRHSGVKDQLSVSSDQLSIVRDRLSIEKDQTDQLVRMGQKIAKERQAKAIASNDETLLLPITGKESV